MSENPGRKICSHEALSIGYYFKCRYDDSLSFYKSYCDENPTTWFTNELYEITKFVENIFENPLDMENLNETEEENYKNAKKCHICEKCYHCGTKSDDNFSNCQKCGERIFHKKSGQPSSKVRDHSHLTGKYRGPAHSECNLNYKDSRVIPVVFHNLSGEFIKKSSLTLRLTW
jgi:hypothetical protein